MTDTVKNPLSGAAFARAAAALLLAFVPLLALVSPASASTRHVVDDVDLLSPGVEATLEAEIARISSTYGQDVVVLYQNLPSGKTPIEAADDYFDYEGYGIGEERSGVLLLVSPSTRDWRVSTRGASIRTFTDKGIKALGEILVEPLGDDDWEGAATEFVRQCERYMKAAEEGHPITSKPRTLTQLVIQGAVALVVGLGGGVLAAIGIVDSFFVSKMTNKGLEPGASAYVDQAGLVISGGQDVFVRRKVTSTPRATDTDSSSGGSSTHTSSSGATHGGGGGKF